MWPHIWRRLEASYIYLSLANIIFEYTHTHTHVLPSCKEVLFSTYAMKCYTNLTSIIIFCCSHVINISCYPIVKSCLTLVTPWTVARQVSLSSTIFWSFIKPLGQWCHPTISSSVTPSPSAFHPSQHQGLFQWVRSSHQVAKVLRLQLQHQPFQWIFREDFL